ncbi:MAG: HupE/UreJ family protein [Betaproteobacteria bacterium]|nr:HupE/UreJ family protein [Betaproteobacteria bacterium]
MRGILGLCLVLLCAPVHAHKPSDSYLSLRVAGDTVQGRWDIAVRDLDFVLDLDSNRDRTVAWGELRRRQNDVFAYALRRLHLDAGAGACPAEPRSLQVDDHTDGGYAVIGFVAACPRADRTLRIRYELFFDVDAQHKGLLDLRVGNDARTHVFSADSAELTLGPEGHSPLDTLTGFGRDGVRHIWAGFDHVLFLLSLLLPAVLVRSGREWRSVEHLSTAMIDTAKVVTAFTAAHSITLCLAFFGIVRLPSAPVEAAIAATVVLAALNNLFPLVRAHRWGVAFAFGLVHGLGFASVLADLALPAGSGALALLGFNAGVELGQLAIVLVFLPLAWQFRGGWIYRRLVLGAGSGATAMLAAVWMVERSLNLRILG